MLVLLHSEDVPEDSPYGSGTPFTKEDVANKAEWLEPFLDEVCHSLFSHHIHFVTIFLSPFHHYWFTQPFDQVTPIQSPPSDSPSGEVVQTLEIDSNDSSMEEGGNSLLLSYCFAILLYRNANVACRRATFSRYSSAGISVKVASADKNSLAASVTSSNFLSSILPNSAAPCSNCLHIIGSGSSPFRFSSYALVFSPVDAVVDSTNSETSDCW